MKFLLFILLSLGFCFSKAQTLKADIEIEIKSGVDTKSESTPTEDTELLSMEDLQRLHHKKMTPSLL